MRHPLCIFLLGLALMLVTASASARVYVEKGEKVGPEQRSEHRFSVTEDTNKFKLTVFFKPEHQGSLRVRFYKPSPRGGWSEMDHMRMFITTDFKQKSTTFDLPKANYKVEITVRRGQYGFKLEDAEEEADD